MPFASLFSHRFFSPDHRLAAVSCLGEGRLGWMNRIRAMQHRAPLLVEVMKHVPEHVGFNVEIKYPISRPQKMSRDDYDDRNAFVDTILSVIFAHAGRRHIVLSCFDPDVCALLRLKQAAFPVLFLTTAGHAKYGRYLDERCNSIPGAIAHCRATGMLGVCSFSTPILEDNALVSLVKASVR